MMHTAATRPEMVCTCGIAEPMTNARDQYTRTMPVQIQRPVREFSGGPRSMPSTIAAPHQPPFKHEGEKRAQ
jgi:hypothetical protein